MFDQHTSLSTLSFQLPEFPSEGKDLLIASAILQSSLLSSVHIWKRPRKWVLCHGKVPNETQASQALKSMIKLILKTKNEVTIHSSCAQHINIKKIHLNIVYRSLKYQTKHVNSQKVEWNSLAGKRTEQKSRTVKGGSERNKCKRFIVMLSIQSITWYFVTFFTVAIQHKQWSETLYHSSILSHKGCGRRFQPVTLQWIY